MKARMLDGPVRCTYRSTYRRPSCSSDLTFFSRCHELATEEPKNSRTPLTACARELVPSPHLLEEDFTKQSFCVERNFFQDMSAEHETNGTAKLLYSVAEAATLLSCSRNTVYGLIKSGEILAIHPTSRARITATALARFLERKESEARSERQSQRLMTK